MGKTKKTSREKPKQYISDIVGEEFKNWKSGKVIITAPTGYGKSQFILDKLIPYEQEVRKKVLILVNRKALLRQYVYEEALREKGLETNAKINTYQAFAGRLKKENNWYCVFEGFDIVVLDEFHFLFADSDFNPSDTLFMWQALLNSFGKCMIFMSATPEEMAPFLDVYQRRIENYYYEEPWARGGADKFWRYSIDPDYSYLEPHIMPEEESLLELVAGSSDKSIIFLDDIRKGRDFREAIKKKSPDKSVVCVSADTMESGTTEERCVLKSMYMANRMDCDILISTSVLDCGVSIHDRDVRNVAIFTTLKVSFMQMLGRVRTEHLNEKLRLYLVPRDAAYWELREQQLEKEVAEIDGLVKDERLEYSCELLCREFLDDSWKADLYRKLFVLVPYSERLPFYDGIVDYLRDNNRRFGGKARLIINQFSVAKHRQLLKTVRQMHVLSRRDILAPCFKQYSWLGIEENDVICQSSTYLESREKKFIERISSVRNYDKEKFMDWKKEVSAEFRRDYLAAYSIRSNSSITKKDLDKVLEKLGFHLLISKDEETRRQLYSIVMMS